MIKLKPNTAKDIGHSFTEIANTKVKIIKSAMKTLAKYANKIFRLVILIDRKLIPIIPRKTGQSFDKLVQEVAFR